MEGMITVNEEPLQHTPGLTVRALLKSKGFVFPLLIVRLDGRLVAREDYDETSVPEGADVEVLHLMSGG